MVAKISVGSSLYGAIAYNGEKINEAQGRLLTTNRIYNDGSGTVDIGKAMEGFLTFLPPQMKIEKPVVHISLNPHPEDVLTDIELQNIAREYLEKLGFGNQPYLVFKHEDIDRHHLHIVTVNVDENGKRLNRDFLYRRSDRIRRELEQKYGLHPAERKNQRLDNSQGLILLTNDGEAANQIMKARNYHEKEYEVTVNKRITNEFIHNMRNPVPLDEINAVTRRCKVTKEGPDQFRIILTQGLNRQIRRMCEYFGYRVTKL